MGKFLGEPTEQDGETGGISEEDAGSGSGRQREHRPMSEGMRAGAGLIAFVFGIAAGFMLAFSWAGFFDKTLDIVVSVFIIAMVVLGAIGGLLFVFRRRLLDYLFNISQTHLASFAEPLTDVTRHALNRDAEGATSAARRLVQLSLARYAWLSTRRWIIASLTALIAALAALAGTALLFKQNQLLAQQSVLLKVQNVKISEQNELTRMNVYLAEADRNASLIVKIADIAAELGKAEAQGRASLESAGPQKKKAANNYITYLDPLDIDPGLVGQIVSVSIAVRPYRFLAPSVETRDESGIILTAFANNRPDLDNVIKMMRKRSRLKPQKAGLKLVSRLTSPERGQLVSVLINSGLRKFEYLNFQGLDLSFARIRDRTIAAVSFQMANMPFSDFSFVEIGKTNFNGARLSNAWFKKSLIYDSDFSALKPGKAPKPYDRLDHAFLTALIGTDFTGCAVMRTSFQSSRLTAARMDACFLADVSFENAELAGASFKGAVLLGVNFTGADLRSADFDNAIVVGSDFLDRLAARAAPKTFKASRYKLEEVPVQAVLDLPAAYAQIDVRVPASRLEGKKLFRIKRTEPFAR